MSDLPSLRSRQVVKALEKNGFVFVRQKGSHAIYRRGNRLVVIPVHTKDLKKPTLRAIIDQAGLTMQEFSQLL